MRPRPTRSDQAVTVGDEEPEFEFAPLPYEDFNRHIDQGLAQLVERWQHLAAPRALRLGRFSRIES